jgi:hypothetical protein
MVTPDPATGASLDRLLAIVERLNGKAVLSAVASTILTRAAIDAWPTGARFTQWLDASVTPHSSTGLLFAVWALVWLAVFERIAAADARAALAQAEEAKRTEAATLAAAADAARRVAFESCSAIEKAVLAYFVRRSDPAQDRTRLVAEVAGLEVPYRRALTKEEDAALRDVNKAVHALSARKFMFPLGEWDNAVLTPQTFEALMADPSLIGLDAPPRPLAPR